MADPVRIPPSALSENLRNGLEWSKADLQAAMSRRWDKASIKVNAEARDEDGVLAIHVHARIVEKV